VAVVLLFLVIVTETQLEEKKDAISKKLHLNNIFKRICTWTINSKEAALGS
jgi:hypothetical protein